jgi:hypothetical protein
MTDFEALEISLRLSLKRISEYVDAFFHRFPLQFDEYTPEQKKILDDLMHEMWRVMSKISESMPTPARNQQAIELLKSWRDGDPEEQRETLESLAGIIADEQGYRAERVMDILENFIDNEELTGWRTKWTRLRMPRDWWQIEALGEHAPSSKLFCPFIPLVRRKIRYSPGADMPTA